MRRALLGTLLLGLLFAGVLASATTINMTPINDGKGTIGDSADYAVVSGIVTISNTGLANITLTFNYPGTTLTSFTDFGIVLNPTDLLFQVGTDNYGIPIVGHNSLTAGHFYSSNSLLTAQTVLGNPSGVTYRNNAFVWLGGTTTDLATLSETISLKGGSTPEFTVTLTGQLPAVFLADINAHGGTAEFGSATCANGYLVGSAPPVPEPASLLLLGSGLLGMGGMIRRRIGKSK